MKFSFKPTTLALLVAGALFAPLTVVADAGGIFDDAPAKKSSAKIASTPSSAKKTKVTSAAKANDAGLEEGIASLRSRIARLESQGFGSRTSMTLPGAIQVQRGTPSMDGLLDDGRASGLEVNMLELKSHQHVADPTLYVGGNFRSKLYYNSVADGADPEARNTAYYNGVTVDRVSLGTLATLNDSMSAFVSASKSSTSSNVNLENAFILMGNLNDSPYYMVVGKNDVNFGNFRRLTPNTDPLIKTWFDAGQKNLVSVGYVNDGLELSATLFNGDNYVKSGYGVNETSSRSIKTPPGHIGNYALTSAYHYDIMGAADLKLGVSLLSSSGFQKDNGGVNPAVDVYMDLVMGRLLVHSEYVRAMHATSTPVTSTGLNGTTLNISTPASYPQDRSIPNAWNIAAAYTFPVMEYDTKASFSVGQFQPNKKGEISQVVLGYTVNVAQGLETGLEYANQVSHVRDGTMAYTSSQIAAVFSAYF